MLLVIIGSVNCRGGKGKYKSVLGDMEKVLTELQTTEKTLSSKLIAVGSGNKNCSETAGLATIDEKLVKIRQELDRLKPADMPMVTNTVQTGLDPATQQPVLETNTTVDWGKITGDDQKIWAYLHTSHTALAAALKTAEVACQCIESGDKNGLFCNIIFIQMPDGRLNLDLASVEKAYFMPVRDIMGGKKGQ
jgi:hypothetical protein